MYKVFDDQKKDNLYEQYKFLVQDIFNENIEIGMDIMGVCGKLLYEIEPMMKDDFSNILLSVELCYFFSVKEIQDSFFYIYEKLCDKYKKGNIDEFTVLIKKFGTSKIRSEFEYKAKIINSFLEKFYDHREAV